MNTETKTIKVEIMPDGITAKSLNHIQDEQPELKDYVFEKHPELDGAENEYDHDKFILDLEGWEKAEQERKIYNIEPLTVDQKLVLYATGEMLNPAPGVSIIKPGTIHEAEIIDEKTVRIV